MGNMKLILTEDVQHLGFAGDIVNVRGGYARNFLIPQKKAMLADPRNVKALEHSKLLAEHKVKKIKKGAEEIAEKLRGITITIARKVGEDEKLFGSVTSIDVENFLKAEGFEIDKRQIHLEKPLKKLGEYIVPVRLHKEVTADVKLMVVKE